MMHEVKPCTVDELAHLVDSARLCGVEIADSFASEVFWFRIGQPAVACGGLMLLGKRAARLVGLFTAPESRGEGRGDAMLRWLVISAVAAGIDRLDAYVKARAVGWYERSGFARGREFSGVGTVHFKIEGEQLVGLAARFMG